MLSKQFVVPYQFIPLVVNRIQKHFEQTLLVVGQHSFGD